MPRLSRVLGGVALGVGACVAYGYATWRPRDLEYLYQGRRLVLGHRGAGAEAPPNTALAMRRAMEAGADGVELDVHLSQDRQVVVIHDATVTSVTGVPGRVREMTLAEIQRLDAGSHFDPAFAGERIPTLEQALIAVGPQGVVNVELKGESLAGDGLEQQVVHIIRALHVADRVIISSFNPLRLWRVRRLDRQIARAMLHGPNSPTYVRHLWLLPLVQPDALHPHYSMVDEAYMARARRWGVRVNVWTVDDAGEARRLVGLGVDGIITNDPRRLGEVVRSA